MAKFVTKDLPGILSNSSMSLCSISSPSQSAKEMKLKGTNKVNVGHERVDKEEVRPSSHRQRIMKALMTDDLARNNEGTDPSSPPTAPASSSSSYSPSRPQFKHGDDVSKSQEISLGSNIHTEELAMRFSENCLEPKDENRENAASIQEMENAIRSLRSWQQNREELIADHSNPSLNLVRLLDNYISKFERGYFFGNFILKQTLIFWLYFLYH